MPAWPEPIVDSAGGTEVAGQPASRHRRRHGSIVARIHEIEKCFGQKAAPEILQRMTR
jgi:hypothetical protein